MKNEAVQTHADLQRRAGHLVAKIEVLEKRLKTAERALFDYFFAAAITGAAHDQNARDGEIIKRASRLAHDAIIERQRWL